MTTVVRQAFTLIELIMVMAIIAVLAILALPQIAAQKARAKRISCVCNLKQVGLSFRIWPIGNRYQMQVSVTNGGTMEWVSQEVVWPHFQVMSNELSTPKILLCPADTRKTNATSFSGLNNWNISYFVGVDADENNPQMLLSGDSNLAVGGVPTKAGLLNLWTNDPVSWTATRHVNQGNIALADGSVQQTGNARLRALSANTGVVTNRLVLP